ncbi:hypothetical protein B0A49_09565 [Cryomyces minteri]|uniref:Uncharacterized protein n=1 Tax=Cryomyces minteri TaxID=331657 RepID=A0A4V5NFT5_9PEZI|nr:hypothetical protein B0A49_09565 [Cryomyces minteri]
MDRTSSQPLLPTLLKNAKKKAPEPANVDAAGVFSILKGIDEKCNTMAQALGRAEIALERAETRADKAEGKMILLEKQIESLMEVIKKQHHEQSQTYASIAGSVSPPPSAASTRSMPSTTAMSAGSVSSNSSASQQSPLALLPSLSLDLSRVRVSTPSTSDLRARHNEAFSRHEDTKAIVCEGII